MWKTKHKRPEDHGNFTEQFPRYNLKRTQEKITLRAIELSQPNLQGKALDAGCGNGFSTAILKKLFKTVKGFDTSNEMLKNA
mgnify:FL=1